MHQTIVADDGHVVAGFCIEFSSKKRPNSLCDRAACCTHCRLLGDCAVKTHAVAAAAEPLDLILLPAGVSRPCQDIASPREQPYHPSTPEDHPLSHQDTPLADVSTPLPAIAPPDELSPPQPHSGIVVPGERSSSPPPPEQGPSRQPVVTPVKPRPSFIPAASPSYVEGLSHNLQRFHRHPKTLQMSPPRSSIR
jgi:hypothetical protein